MPVLRKLSDLKGYSFQAKNDEMGRLKQVYFDDQLWKVRYLIVQTGSWLLGKEVLLVPAVITGIDDNSKAIQVNLSRKQIKNAPSVDSEQPVSEHYQQQYYSYYEWEPYWITDPLFQATPVSPPLFIQPETPTEPENPHLRSSDEVSGYRLDTPSGSIGHVADIILDDQEWTVRYLEIDTRNWLPGKHVLVSPAWVQKIDWVDQQVQVELSRELVLSAPEYDSSKHISRDYQLALFKHYGKDFLD
jgi:uncharacterized protein YrrD